MLLFVGGNIYELHEVQGEQKWSWELWLRGNKMHNHSWTSRGEVFCLWFSKWHFWVGEFCFFCTFLSIGKCLFTSVPKILSSVLVEFWKSRWGRLGWEGADHLTGTGINQIPRGDIGVETNRLRAACPFFLVYTPISQKNTWAIDHKRHGLITNNPVSDLPFSL